MSKVIVQAVQMLNAGIEGSNVVDYLRKHYNTTCSLKTQVSMVKKLYILQKDGNRHPEYTDLIHKFTQYYRRVQSKIDPTCKQNTEQFLNANFFMQYKTHNRHKKKLFCIGYEGLDRRFKRLKFLPLHLKSLKITADESISCRTQERG